MVRRLFIVSAVRTKNTELSKFCSHNYYLPNTRGQSVGFLKNGGDDMNSCLFTPSTYLTIFCIATLKKIGGETSILSL